MSITAAAVMRLAIQQGIGWFIELQYDHRLYGLLLKLTGLHEEASLGLPSMPPHNRFFTTFDDVLTAVSRYFNCWRTPNSLHRRLCGLI